MNTYNRYCFVLVRDKQDKVLMGRRNDTDKFTNPGGGAEKNECPYHCAAREFKEETGADIKSLKIVKLFFHNGSLIYLFEGELPEGCEFDSSNDPDLEVEEWEFVDPFSVINELNVPAEENEIIKYWAYN
jgi:8-oxo-dGTP pyrophosphatase MutT (NUDIX family)